MHAGPCEVASDHLKAGFHSDAVGLPVKVGVVERFEACTGK